VNLNILLNTEEIARRVNQLYHDPVYEGEIRELGSRVVIKKRSPIRVFGENGLLKVEAPLSVRVRITLTEKLLGGLDVYTPKIDQTDFEITAHFATELKADAYWRLMAHTEAHFNWDQKPSWGLGRFQMKINTLLRPFVQEQLRNVARRIDHFIEQEVGLDQRASEAWAEAQQPLRLSEELPLWLEIGFANQQPQATPIHCTASEIGSQLAIPVSITTFLGKKPQAKQKLAFPPFSFRPEIPREFVMPISSVLSYRAFSDLLEGEVLEVVPDRLKVQIRSLRLKHSKGKLNTSASLGGRLSWGPLKLSFRLVMFISLLPRWDKMEKRFVLEELDHAFLTPQWWLRLYDRLRGKAFARRLRQEMEAYIARIDQQVAEGIRQQLQAGTVGHGLRLRGELHDFEHQRLDLQKEGMNLHSILRGVFRVEVEIE
jgi:hypothetical protein